MSLSQPNHFVISVIFANLTTELHIQDLDFSVLDSLNTKLIRAVRNTTNTSLSLKKNILNVFDCNLKKDDRILIISGRNIYETTSHQMTVWFPTASNVCSCTTWGKITNKILHFYRKWYCCLIYLTHKNTFCSHF